METANGLKQHILLFGMTGGTGRLIAKILTESGYDVIGIARDPAKVTLYSPNLQVVKGDINKPQTYRGLIQQCNGVISAVSDRSRMPTTVYSDGVRNILNAMNGTLCKRLICISAFPVEISPAISVWQKWLLKYIIRKIFKHSYKDLLVMETLVRKSDVDWTIMRPPRLKDSPPTGKYRFAINTHLKKSSGISRGDLAHYICDILNKPETFKSTIEIAY